MRAAGSIVGVMLGALVGAWVNLVAWRVPRALPVSGVASLEAAPRTVWGDFKSITTPAHASKGRGRGSGEVAVRFPLLQVVTGGLFGLTVLRFGVTWLLPAYLCMATMAVLLTVIDAQHQRLPNLVVVPSAAVGLVLLAVAELAHRAGDSFLRGIVGGVALFLIFLVMALLSPKGLGLGDVKLAGVLGLFLGYLGWRTLIVGGVGGFLVAAVVSVVLLAARRVRRDTLIPFGPSMLLAAMAAVLLHPS